jgi:transposase
VRRLDRRRCGVVTVEEVPWGDGKRTLTKAYMVFLARWARRLSWKETAEAFRTSWDKVFDAVEYVVTWGLEHRTLGQIDAIGVDEIQYSNGHRYLTLLKEAFQQLRVYSSPAWAGKFLDEWCQQTMRSRIEPMKKIARSLRQHRELILNYFRAQKLISSGVVEGLNNKAKVTLRNPMAFAPTGYSNRPFITRLASCLSSS